jgi:hypothetical protein
MKAVEFKNDRRGSKMGLIKEDLSFWIQKVMTEKHCSYEEALHFLVDFAQKRGQVFEEQIEKT